MRIAFDLDGTLYDAFPIIFAVNQHIREILGYPPMTAEDYIRNFQTRDWTLLYKSLGISECDIEKVIALFTQEFAQTDPPQLIPHGKEAIIKAFTALGLEHVFFITNDPMNRVRKRFQRDDLEQLLLRVKTPFQGKSQELFTLASQESSAPFVYIGDLVSDGEDCAEARHMGAHNVFFYGMTHPYAMNHPDAMERFVSQHPSFAKTLKTIEAIDTLWNQS